MERQYHLYRDLGIRKASLCRKFFDRYGDRNDADADAMRELLARRTQAYHFDELVLMVGYYASAHDECVLDYPESYSPVERWQARQVLERYEAICLRLAQLHDGRQDG